jgi:hypothetical protein
MNRAGVQNLWLLLPLVALAAGCEQASSHATPLEKVSRAVAEPAPAKTDVAAVKVSQDDASQAESVSAEPEKASEVAPASAAEVASEPASQKLSEVAEKDAAPAAAGQRQEVTFDDIKFDMVKGTPFKREMLTPKIEELVGKPIRIRGYIFPTFQQSGITQFVLVRDNLECCFGPGAALFDCIVVTMNPGKTADYTVRPVTVDGVFSVQELKDPDGNHIAIYAMAGEAVK